MRIHIIKRFAAAALATAALVCAGVTATTGVAAAGTGYAVSPGGTPYWIAAWSDSMPISVADASYEDGHRIIQWWNTGGDEQKWYFDSVYFNNKYLGFMLRNKRSNLCIKSNGVAGGTAIQTACRPDDNNQIFTRGPVYDTAGILLAWTYTNLATGLRLDVEGNSTSGGANIDLWYPNGDYNQAFFLTATG